MSSISLSAIPSWDTVPVSPPKAKVDLGPLAESENAPQSHWDVSPFPVDEAINARISFWVGDIAQLEVDAIVNSTNESMMDRSGQSATIMMGAGQDLVLEIENMGPGHSCKTGETRVTKGHGLPAKHIIHTVGPRYKENYRVAAENALHNSYRNSLQECSEIDVKTVAFSVVHLARRGFPAVGGAHIACRTIRRHLEKPDTKIKSVVLVMPPNDSALISAYEEVLPLYFPRNAEEQEIVTPLLPADVGNEDGETVIEERKIRIDPIVAPKPDGREQLIAPEAIDKTVTASFARMSGDTDDAKLARLASRPTEEREAEREYWHYVSKARDEDLSDVAAHNFLYQSGVDPMGRPLLVIVAKWFPAERVGYDRVLMYVVSMLDSIVQRDYAIVYLHSGAIDDNMPPLKFLLKAYNMFNWKYKKNLKALYIVHRSFWLRAAMWFMTPFVSSKFWRKVKYIDQVRDLFNHIDNSQLQIPPHVIEVDRELNGYTGEINVKYSGTDRGVRSHSEL